MNPRLRELCWLAGALLCAIVTGINIAQGALVPVIVALLLSVPILVSRYSPVSSAALVLSVLILGYFIGNRGFAQLSPVARLPLFPAEIGLAITCTGLIVTSALRRTLPIRKDGLNLAICLWMLFCFAKLLNDIRGFGILALRDFATIYYASFFFVAQQTANDESDRRWIGHSLLIGATLLLPTYVLTRAFPEFVENTLSVRGTPLIFFKGDLLGVFLVISSMVLYLVYDQAPRRQWALLLSLASAGVMLTTNNRASLVAFVVASVCLGISRRWRFLAYTVTTGAVFAVGMLAWAGVRGQSWQETPLYSMYERVISIGDFAGTGTYTGDNTHFKGDNNRFRSVWWEIVITRTWRDSPWTGLGFGEDLAAEFFRVYYPDSTEETSVRSPHNILITLFARTGLIGLGLFFIILALAARTSWKVLRNPMADPILELAPVCAAWSILACACFGVVLEGPMGAVIFWSTLGLINRSPTLATGSTATAMNEETPPHPERLNVQQNALERP